MIWLMKSGVVEERVDLYLTSLLFGLNEMRNPGTGVDLGGKLRVLF